MAYSSTSDVYRVTGLTSDDVIEASVTSFIAVADAEIDRLTGQSYSTPAELIEYYDGVKTKLGSDRFIYQTTENDMPSRDTIMLNHWPVTSVNYIYYLERDKKLDKVFSTESTEASFTDNTTEANSDLGTAFNLFPTGTTGDRVYLGCSYKFSGISFDLNTLGSDGAIAVEYYNGSWIAVSGLSDGTAALSADGKISFTLPSDWTKVAVNSSTKYWLRLRVTSSFASNPSVFKTYLDSNTVINTVVDMANVHYDSTGRVTMITGRWPDGVKNIKISYNYGRSSVPAIITELSAIIAGLSCFNAVLGALYGKPESYTIGSMSATRETFAKINLMITQLNMRKDQLLAVVGRRVHFAMIG